MRTLKVGCVVVVTLVLIGVAGIWMWASRPPYPKVPVRQYPPNNAYEHLVVVALRLHEAKRFDVRLQSLSDRAIDALRQGGVLTTLEHQEYARRVEPYLRVYRRYLNQPSRVVIDYWRKVTQPQRDPQFMAYGAMRELARTEAYFIQAAFLRNQPAEAVERAAALSQFANQISRDGMVIDYLVGVAIKSIAIEPVRRNFARITQRQPLERLLRWARQEEQNRPSLVNIMQSEQEYGRAVILVMYQNGVPIDPSTIEWWERIRILNQLIIKTSVREYEASMERVKAYAAKPFWQQNPADYPRPWHPLNQTIIPVFQSLSERDAELQARTRLLGCAAAVRLYRIRTGRYPSKLEQLHLGDLIIDPFTGKPFIYRVDARKGFLLYSVGSNGVDDGGRCSYASGGSDKGDLLPVGVRVPPSLRGVPPERMPLTDPIWLR